MNDEQMNAALEAISKRSETLLGLVDNEEARTIVDEIVALSRYKFDVIGKNSGNNPTRDSEDD